MSKKSDAMRRKAKQMARKNLKKARVQLAKLKARTKVELARHTRAFRLAAKRYKAALRNS